MILPPFFVIPLSLANIATGNERAERPAIHLGEPKHPGLVWQSNGASNVWARGQFSGTQAVDFVSMISANALAGTTIRVRLGTSQAQVDGTAPYDSGVVPFISPAATTSNARYHSHLEIGSVQNASWWRIDIGSHTGDFEAAALIMGKALRVARFYDRNYERGAEDLGGVDYSTWGVAEETPGIIMRTIGFRLSSVFDDEFEGAMEKLLYEQGKRGLVYCCFDPQANDRRQQNTYLGRLKQLPFATGVQIPGRHSMEFSLQSMI